MRGCHAGPTQRFVLDPFVDKYRQKHKFTEAQHNKTLMNFEGHSKRIDVIPFCFLFHVIETYR